MYSNQKIKLKKKGAPSWIVTFADMMALLLTFFIMLLSMSSMDSKKYEAVVESLEEAFGEGSGNNFQSINAKLKDMKTSQDNLQDTLNEPETLAVEKSLQRAKEILKKEIQQESVQLHLDNGNIILRFPERVAFTSGSEELTENFDTVIVNLITLLKEFPGTVTISGHTDDLPIDTFRFRSNWELSSARAVSVLHAILESSDLNSERFTVQGHADTLPVVDNNSSDNRAENRRVEISIEQNP